MTLGDLVTEALQELQVLGAGEAPSAEDMALGVSLGQRIFDDWAAERETVYATVFTNYTLTANLAPHTIGPTGTFVVTQRPVSLEGANLRLTTSSPVVHLTIHLRDEQWWLAQPVPLLTSEIPTDLFYRPSWPNGELNLWPVPTVAYGVQLQTRVLLTVLDESTDDFSLPPGYRSAFTLTLAEAMAPGLGVALAASTRAEAMRARARIERNNRPSRRLVTQDAGVPSRGRGGSFNWLTREIQ